MPHPYKCPAHNMWMKKDKDGVKTCELCLLERDKRHREYERLGGSHKPKVKTTKI